MSTPDEFREYTLHASKTKWVGILLLSLLFVAGGALMIHDGKPMGWLASGFFGFGAVISTVALMPGASSLKLSPEGFICTSLFRKGKLTPWSHVAFFGVTVISLNRMVAWDYVEEHRPSGATLSKTICGFEAALPDTYGTPPGKLVEIMETWRARYGARSPG